MTGEYQPASAGSIWVMAIIIIIIMMNVWWAIGDVIFLSEPELCLSSGDKEKEKKLKLNEQRNIKMLADRPAGLQK